MNTLLPWTLVFLPLVLIVSLVGCDEEHKPIDLKPIARQALTDAGFDAMGVSCQLNGWGEANCFANTQQGSKRLLCNALGCRLLPELTR